MTGIWFNFVSEVEVRAKGALPVVFREEICSPDGRGRSHHLLPLLLPAQPSLPSTSPWCRGCARQSLLRGCGSSVQRLLHVTTHDATSVRKPTTGAVIRSSLAPTRLKSKTAPPLDHNRKLLRTIEKLNPKLNVKVRPRAPVLGFASQAVIFAGSTLACVVPKLYDRIKLQ